MQHALIAFLLLFCLVARADRCEQVLQMACDPKLGELKDHTGAVGSSSPNDAKKFFDEHDAKIETAATKLADLWWKKPGAKKVVPAVGLNGSKECANQSSDECRKAIQKRTKDILLGNLSDGLLDAIPKGKISARGLDGLMNTREVGQILADLDSGIRDAVNPQYKKDVETMLAELKAEVAAVASKYLPKTKEVQARLDKLAKIKFVGHSGCPPMNEQDQSLVGLLENNAAYDEKSNDITICNGFQNLTTSRYAILATLAHEVGHSIDHCRFGEDAKKSHPTLKAADEKSPWRKVIECLRKPDSVKAVYHGNNFSPKNCATKDQAGEALADFISAEVLGRMLAAKKLGHANPDETAKGFANIQRAVCVDEGDKKKVAVKSAAHDEHPKARDRISRLLLMNPEVRKALKCDPLPASRLYCGGDAMAADGDQPATKVNSAPKKVTR